MIFSFDILIELDDVVMMNLIKNSRLVDNFSLPRLVHPLDSNKLQLLLSSGFEDNRILSLCLLLVNMIFVHLNYDLCYQYFEY